MTEKINDFGFTAHKEQNDGPEIHVANTNALEVQLNAMRQDILKLANSDSNESEKLKQMEEIITPLLNGLIDTADKDWIHWPNRRPILEAKLQEIKRITRG